MTDVLCSSHLQVAGAGAPVKLGRRATKQVQFSNLRPTTGRRAFKVNATMSTAALSRQESDDATALVHRSAMHAMYNIDIGLDMDVSTSRGDQNSGEASTSSLSAHADDEAHSLLNAFKSSFGWVVGDIIGQGISGDPYDWVQSVKFGTFGFLYDGPLGKILKNGDALTWVPITTCIAFAVLKTIEGQPGDVIETLQDKMVGAVVANYLLWPIATHISNHFVPKQHRKMFNQVLRVVWSAVISSMGHTPLTDPTGVLDAVSTAQHAVCDSLHAGSMLEHCAADALDDQAGWGAFATSAFAAMQPVQSAVATAVRQMQRLPSGMLERAFSKCLDILSPLQQLEKTPSLLEGSQLSAVLDRSGLSQILDRSSTLKLGELGQFMERACSFRAGSFAGGRPNGGSGKPLQRMERMPSFIAAV